MIDVRDIESEVDLKMNLLYGGSMTSERLNVKPLTIRRIMEMGFSNYNRYLSILTLDKKSVTKDDPIYDGMSLGEIIIKSGNSFLINSFSEAMCAFLGEKVEDVLVHETLGFVFGGMDTNRNPEDCNVVNANNFLDFIQIIKYQNCLTDPSQKYIDKTPMNPADEKARRILEKIKKGKEMVEQAKASASTKKDGSSNTDFADVISAVSTKSNNYNRNNIWDATIYQLYDEYKRLEAISSYDINIAAMIQGAKINDLKHWSAKIE